MPVMGQFPAESKQTGERAAILGLITGRRFRWALYLSLIPTIFCLVAFQLTKVSGPTWLSNNFENSYAYLFNSLLLVKGYPPSWIDHPGTTTQFFGAAVLRISEPGSSDQIVNAVLDNPDKFIKRIQRSLLIFAAGCLWLFPWLTALRTRSWVTALLLQIPSLFFVTLLKYTTWFSSDLMLVPWCVAGICLSVDLVHSRFKGASQTRIAVLAGIVIGLGIFTKLTFFPIILLILAAGRGFRIRLIVGAACLLAATVIALPIYPRFGTLISWIGELVTHTGRYGEGEAGFTRPDILAEGATRLISWEPMILWLPLFSTLALLILRWGVIRRETTSQRPLALTGLILLGLQIVGFFLVAKHPGPHYLIPLYLSTGLNLALLYEAARMQKRLSVPACFGWAALTALLIWTLGGSTVGTAALFRWLDSWRKGQLSMYERVKRLTKDDLRIDYYRSSTPEFAAFYGNAYTQYLTDNGYTKENYFGPLLEKRYPHAMFTFFFTSDMEFYTFTRELSPSSMIAGRQRFYLFGNHADATYDKDNLMQIPGLDPKDLKEIDSGGYTYLDEWTRGETQPR